MSIVDHAKKMMVLNGGRWFAVEYRLCKITVSENPSLLTCSDLSSNDATIRMMWYFTVPWKIQNGTANVEKKVFLRRTFFWPLLRLISPKIP